jgi:hypothetical protein
MAKKHLTTEISHLTDNVVNYLYIIVHDRDLQSIANDSNTDFRHPFIEMVG